MAAPSWGNPSVQASRGDNSGVKESGMTNIETATQGKASPAMDRQVTLADLFLLVAGAREDVADGLGTFEDMLMERVALEMEYQN